MARTANQVVEQIRATKQQNAQSGVRRLDAKLREQMREKVNFKGL